MFDIKENLKKLPDTPGVYMHKDKMGQVIYVGKAISLRNRVRQYFQSQKNMAPKVRAMVSHIAEFEYITTATEMEALILECNLIKKYMPKYNVLLRDDKTYPYIRVTMSEDYPRVLKTRRLTSGGDRFFGPYSDAGAVSNIVELLNDVYRLKRCSTKSFPELTRPCLNYHIDKCQGICCGKTDLASYRRDVEKALEFLSGKTAPLEGELRQRMLKCSENLEFEKAARYRDFLSDIKSLSQTQRVVNLGMGDLDIVLGISSSVRNYAVVFFVRGGKLSGRENFRMEGEGSRPELVREFLKQYYTNTTAIPGEILLEEDLSGEEEQLIAGYLSELSGRQVKIFVPQRGHKRDLLKLAQKDSLEMLKTIDQRENSRMERQKAVTQAIGALGERITGRRMNRKEYRVEAYDISNTNGLDSVGAMVVFEGLRPNRKLYRRFKIRTTEGPDDYGSLQEVLYRRFKRALEGDKSFTAWPDVIFMDGGKGQVSAALTMLSALKLEIPVVGMAKDDHHRTRALVYKPYQSDDFEEISLRETPMLFKYVGVIQEEVHRFAIEYHRGLRAKHLEKSILDEIPGVGPKRRMALLRHFGSVEAIKKASAEELMEVPEVNRAAAEKIVAFFAGRK